MQTDEELTTKLWLEIDKVNQKSSANYPFSLKKITLKKKLLSNLTVFKKESNINLEVILHAAWGILISRFSTADHITYGTTELNVLKITKNIPISKHIKLIKCDIDEKTSVKNLCHKIHQQIKNKNSKKKC